MTEDYQRSALRKEPITAPFIEQFKRATLRKFYISASNNLLNHLIFLDFLLIGSDQQGALLKEPVTAPFIERVKIANLRKYY